MSDAAAVQQAIALLVERFGGIDLLINNAGITHRSRVADTSLAVFERIMAVNWLVKSRSAALPINVAASDRRPVRCKA